MPSTCRGCLIEIRVRSALVCRSRLVLGARLGLLTHGSGRAGNGANLAPVAAPDSPPTSPPTTAPRAPRTDRTTRVEPWRRGPASGGPAQPLPEPGTWSSCFLLPRKFPGGCRAWYGTKLTWVSPSGASERSGPSTTDTCRRSSLQEAGAFTRNRNSFRSPLPTTGMTLDVSTSAIAAAHPDRVAGWTAWTFNSPVSPHVFQTSIRRHATRILLGILNFAERNTQGDDPALRSPRWSKRAFAI